VQIYHLLSKFLLFFLQISWRLQAFNFACCHQFCQKSRVDLYFTHSDKIEDIQIFYCNDRILRNFTSFDNPFVYKHTNFGPTASSNNCQMLLWDRRKICFCISHISEMGVVSQQIWDISFFLNHTNFFGWDTHLRRVASHFWDKTGFKTFSYRLWEGNLI